MPHGKGDVKTYTGYQLSGEWKDGDLRFGKISRGNEYIYEGEIKNLKANGQGELTLY